MKINYIDFEGEPAMTITSFDDYIMDYHKYKGKRVIVCKHCQKRVVVKPKSPAKSCKECSKEAIKKYDRERKNSKKP